MKTAYSKDILQNDRIVIIVRGLSGSGKSTLTQKIKKDADDLGKISFVCSADSYFMPNGVYEFDGLLLPEAHTYCRELCRLSLKKKFNVVIIDNTNIKYEHFKPYLEMAKDANYKVCLVEPTTKWKNDIQALEVKNTHNVPTKSLRRQKSQFETAKTVHDKIMADFDAEFNDPLYSFTL